MQDHFGLTQHPRTRREWLKVVGAWMIGIPMASAARAMGVRNRGKVFGGYPKAGAVAPPIGLFVCRGPNPTPEREVDFPFVDGWLVRPGWDRVEPTEGQYDWTYIDTEIALARKLKKRVTLAILGGPQTPDWVYRSGAKEFAYTMPVGPRGTVRIPLLWDEAYRKKWTALIKALGKRYQDNPTVALVHMTGATGNGLEMQLPAAPGDTAKWEDKGYTPERVISAWQEIMDTYAAAFPNLPLDIDIHPVLGTDRVAQAVAAHGARTLSKRFGIFGGWLSGRDATQDRHHAGMQALAKEYGPKGFSAWQMIASFTRTPNQYPEAGLRAAFEQGISWNARYFEIWETDAMNESLHPLLREMAARLHR